MRNSILEKIKKINLNIEKLKDQKNATKSETRKLQIQAQINKKETELANFLDQIAIPLKEAVKIVAKKKSPEEIEKFIERKTAEKEELEDKLIKFKEYKGIKKYKELLDKIINKSISIEEMTSEIYEKDGNNKTFMNKLKEILPKAEYTILENTVLEAQEIVKGKQGEDYSKFVRYFNLLVFGTLEETMPKLTAKSEELKEKEEKTEEEISQMLGINSQNIEGEILKATKQIESKLERINQLLSRPNISRAIYRAFNTIYKNSWIQETSSILINGI